MGGFEGVDQILGWSEGEVARLPRIWISTPQNSG